MPDEPALPPIPGRPPDAPSAKLPLPLAGIRVLDATHIVAGPFCSLILADMGAEVIKIERPGSGDLSRARGPFVYNAAGERMSSRFLGVNRNKKSVSIDLRHPRCRQAFEQLVRASDVLLDNWGAGAFRRLGLGYDRLSELNPGLVYASITGYGDSAGLSGPYSSWPANNLAIQAMSGWMEITGGPDGPPQSVADNIGDSIPGLWTALGIVLALETRRQTGRGQHLDMAMYECMMSHIESNMNHYQATGAAPGRSWERLATAGLTFKAADGYVVLAGARTEGRLRSLWQAIGRADLAADPRFLGGDLTPDFLLGQVIPALEEWAQSRTKFQVAETLVDLGFSMGMAQTLEELAHCPHLAGRRMFVDTGDTLGGVFRSVETPVRLTACEDAPAETPPTLGQHNREILGGLGGLSPGELEALAAEGAL